jgi:hypothetical protein
MQIYVDSRVVAAKCCIGENRRPSMENLLRGPTDPPIPAQGKTSVLAARNRRVRGKNEDSHVTWRWLRHLGRWAAWRAPPEPQSATRRPVVNWRTRGLGVAFFAALIASVAHAEPRPWLVWQSTTRRRAPLRLRYAALSRSTRHARSRHGGAGIRQLPHLATEVYLSDVADARFFEAMQFDDGRRLEPLLGTDGYARLKLALGDTAPADDVLARTKPWAALLRIAAPQPPVDGATLDRELVTTARVRHMTILGLEWLDEQIAALDAIPLDTQVAVLRHAIDDRAGVAAQIEPTIQAWLKRDLAALSRINLAEEAGDPELARHYALLTRHIVDNRTVVMAHRLFLPLRAGKVFVAVGALHLYGERGLLALLRQQGYQVRRIY